MRNWLMLWLVFQGLLEGMLLIGDELLEYTPHILHHFSLKHLLFLDLILLLSNKGFQQEMILCLFKQDLGKVGVLQVFKVNRGFKEA